MSTYRFAWEAIAFLKGYCKDAEESVKAAIAFLDAQHPVDVAAHQRARSAEQLSRREASHTELLAIHEAVMNPDAVEANDSDTFTLKMVKEFIFKFLEYKAASELADAWGKPVPHTPDEEARLLHAVLDQARETLLVSIKGTPDELQKSLGKLNMRCKAHYDWRTAKVEVQQDEPFVVPLTSKAETALHAIAAGNSPSSTLAAFGFKSDAEFAKAVLEELQSG